MRFKHTSLFLVLGLVTLASTCCSHLSLPHQPKPVSGGTYAVWCDRGHEVWCQAGEHRCATFEAATAAINQEVPGLLVWKGAINPNLEAALFTHHETGEIVIIAIPDAAMPDPNSRIHSPIAVTQPIVETATACLGDVAIFLTWPEAGLSANDWTQNGLHEMLHAVGMDHADSETHFSTVMRPDLSMERRISYSIADKNWLHAVYMN